MKIFYRLRVLPEEISGEGLKNWSIKRFLVDQGFLEPDEPKLPIEN